MTGIKSWKSGEGMGIMATPALLVLLACCLVAGCDNFTPREKTARHDPASDELTMPYPCPDWSQSQVHNYKNATHSNFGCAVNSNLAIQLENPADLHRGHGALAPDTEITTHVIEQYRTGDLPAALEPLQSSGTGQ